MKLIKTEHRDNFPIKEVFQLEDGTEYTKEYSYNGTLITEHYNYNNISFRTIVHDMGYHDNENYSDYKEEYYFIIHNNNKSYHRENGPAYIQYYEDGSIRRIEYLKYDILHNENGPAYIFYDIDGTIKQDYYYNGRCITELYNLHPTILTDDTLRKILL